MKRQIDKSLIVLKLSIENKQIYIELLEKEFFPSLFELRKRFCIYRFGRDLMIPSINGVANLKADILLIVFIVCQ